MTFKLRSGNSALPFKQMGASPAKDVGTHKHPHPKPEKKTSTWEKVKAGTSKAYDKASQIGMGVKAFAKEALGTKEHHMGGGYGRKDPAWEYTKAYQKEMKADEDAAKSKKENKGKTKSKHKGSKGDRSKGYTGI